MTLWLLEWLRYGEPVTVGFTLIVAGILGGIGLLIYGSKRW